MAKKSFLFELCDYSEAILVAAAFALFFKAFVFQIFEIPSSSMEDNLLVGDRIVVDKFIYAPHPLPWAKLLPYRNPRRGDVLVFKYPNDPTRDFIKRVVGLPGDVVAIDDKVVSVNGVPQKEPWVVHRDPEILPKGGVPQSVSRRDHLAPLRVPEGAWYAMGDNRDESQDSRFFGPVPEALVKGRAVVVLWSYDPGGATAYEGRGAAVRRVLDTALHFLSRTRWNRTFKRVR